MPATCGRAPSRRPRTPTPPRPRRRRSRGNARALSRRLPSGPIAFAWLGWPGYMVRPQPFLPGSVMSDVFKEVDEDLRREQLKSIWDRFGIYIIGAAVLIVVATGGYRLWEYWQDRKAEQEGDRFIEAMAAA